ncbi:putative membrane protein, partial [Vibrio parahaemolyticus V-223/04]
QMPMTLLLSASRN